MGIAGKRAFGLALRERVAVLSRTEAGRAAQAQRTPPYVWGIALLAIALRIGIAWATHFTSEDYLITLRYAENLAHRRGLVFNPGERVLGTTTPLYTLFLALTIKLGLPATLCGKGVNILADGLLCTLMYRWLSVVGQRTAGVVAAFWVAINPLHIQWAISGMETSLVTACGLWVWLAYAERRTLTAYLAGALLFLLRWDSLLLTGVLTAALLWRERRLPLRALTAYGLLIAPWLIFAAWYYGNPIPVTAAAKATVYGWRADHEPAWLLRYLPRLPEVLHRFLGINEPAFRAFLLAPHLADLPRVLFGAPGYALITLFAALGLARVVREHWTMFWPPLAWFMLYWIAFLLSRVLLFPWYLVPPLPVYGALVALGLTAVARRIGERWPRSLQTTAAASALGLSAIAGAASTLQLAHSAQWPEDRVRIPLGLWLKAHSRPTDRILLEPIGYIGYYSERPVLDIVGLVTPQVLPFYRPENPAPVLNIAEAFRPEWCCVRASWSGCGARHWHPGVPGKRATRLSRPSPARPRAISTISTGGGKRKSLT